MHDFIRERRDRLYETCGHLGDSLIIRKPLLAGIRLASWQFRTIRNYVNVYLYDSIEKISGCDQLRDSMLYIHEYDIGQLPNITPNGLLLPKKHNLLSYNLMMGGLANLIKSLGLKHVDRIHFPINVRIIDGRPNHTTDSRPRASTKLHSDIWAGEYSDHIMILIPLEGDMYQNGVELFEPGPDFYPGYVKAMDDYADGAHLEATSTKYDVTLEVGNVYLLDSFLLHRTMKRRPGLRMVINFAFMPNRKVPSDLEVKTDRNEEYISADDWYQIGTNKIVVTDSEARRFDVSETNRTIQNRYADDYRLVDLVR